MRHASHFTRSYKNYNVGDSIMSRIIIACIILFYLIGLIFGSDALRFLTSWTY